MMNTKKAFSITGMHVAIVGTILFIVAGLLFLGKSYLFPTSVGMFLSTTLITPVVTPLGGGIDSGIGIVEIKAVLRPSVAADCKVSTEYFIELSDGSVLETQGSRRTFKGSLRTIDYKSGIPTYVPGGPSTFYVRDTYDCGPALQVLETAHAHFTIIPFTALPAGQVGSLPLASIIPLRSETYTAPKTQVTPSKVDALGAVGVAAAAPKLVAPEAPPADTIGAPAKPPVKGASRPPPPPKVEPPKAEAPKVVEPPSLPDDTFRRPD